MEKVEVKPQLTEGDQYYIEHRDLMQQTAREQDIVDGGSGETIYVFTYTDVKELGWTEVKGPDRNIRHLFNGNK